MNKRTTGQTTKDIRTGKPTTDKRTTTTTTKNVNETNRTTARGRRPTNVGLLENSAQRQRVFSMAGNLSGTMTESGNKSTIASSERYKGLKDAGDSGVHVARSEGRVGVHRVDLSESSSLRIKPLKFGLPTVRTLRTDLADLNGWYSTLLD